MVAVTAAGALAVTGLAVGLAPTVSSAATGINLALPANGGVVSASGNEVSDGRWTPELAVDGDDSTRWSSNASDTAWLQVRLGEPSVIDHVTIKWEAACAARYKLQVSDDGSTWTDATGEISPTCATTDRQSLNAATAGREHAYVRMQALDRTPIGGSKWGVSLYEFEIWNGEEPGSAAPSGVDLVPLPSELTQDGGEPFVLEPSTSIVASGAAAPVAELLAEQLRPATGFALPVVSSATGSTITLTLDPRYEALAGPSPEDAYDLVTAPGQVQITAREAHGLFNGAQTLRQLFPPTIFSQEALVRDWTAPAVTVRDAPRFAHRGAQADTARSFIEVDELKEMIDTLSSVKVSRLHLHLADDQGWRIEITNEGRAEGDDIDYTLLAGVSGSSAMWAVNDPSKPYTNELGRTGFYTQEEYRDVVAYAAERFVTIVPEIDAPSHSNAMLHAIPQLNSANTRPAVTVYGTAKEQNNGNVGESTLDTHNPATWVALRHIFGQIIDMTPGDYFHIGGDESHVTPHDDYVDFVTKSIALVRELGKTPIGWNEYAEAGLGAGDVVQYWTGGTTHTAAAVANGAKVVVSKSDSAYLDMKYSSKTPIGLTWAGQGDLDKYYNWNPVNVIPNSQESDLLGVEGPMWSETIRGGDQNEFMMFPRAIAHAEVGWTPQTDRNLADFLERMEPMGVRMLVQDRNFYDGNKVAWGTDAAGKSVKAATGEAARIDVATIAAPGTKVASDGRSIAVDTVDDIDGVSNSSLTGALSATIDFGDGVEVPAVFTAVRDRSDLSAGSRYEVGAEHAYSTSGAATATVTFSDGRVVTGQISVEDGYVAPQPPVFDACVLPSATLASETVRDDARVLADLAGFEPESYVRITWDGAHRGYVLTDEDGLADLSLYVEYQEVKGKHLLRATGDDGRFIEKLIDVDSRTQPLTGEPITGASATASSEATNETAPNGLASALVDGDRSTFWHSSWSPVAPFDHTITVDLATSHDLKWLTWVPRQNSDNGQVKDFTLSFSEDNETWTTPVAQALPVGRGATQIELSDTARYVGIVISSNHAGTNSFATIGELEFRGLEPGQSESTPTDPVVSVWTPGEGCASSPDVDAPAVEEIVDVAVEVGETINIGVVATDESLPLSYAATGLPVGVSIDPATGVVSGEATEPGTYQVTVRVTDAADNLAEVAFTITVTAKPSPSPTPSASPSQSVKPTPTPSVEPTVKPDVPRSAPYTLPGTHVLNGRTWFTRCEGYSQTERCRTEIWATTVVKNGSSFEVRQGWAFNNLTYLPMMTRAQWQGNPLTVEGAWSAPDGRKWYTECDTAATGANGCRSYTWTTVYSATPKAGGGYTFSHSGKWVFNNIVQFATR